MANVAGPLNTTFECCFLDSLGLVAKITFVVRVTVFTFGNQLQLVSFFFPYFIFFSGVEIANTAGP